MDIRLEDRDGILVIRPMGDLTAQTAPNLRAIFDAHITKANPSIVLDAQDIKYIDSAGLGSLVSGLHRSREYAGQFLVCGLQNDVESIFELTRMNSLFKVFPSADQAVVALEG
ncbi:MAG TPA: STAS domain-containing protein [bacterium]|nr:STAS domain-containing protein [bacterium]